MKKLQHHTLLVPAILSILTILLTANSSNPPQDYTGAPPFNRTCSSCHGGGNNFDGTIQLTGLPDEILPGSEHTVTITVSNPNGMATRAGFQMVAIDENNNGVGTYGLATGGAATQNDNNRTYVEHRGAQPFDGNNNATWTITFTAPNFDVPDMIKFYAVGNIANGGGTGGDRIVTTTKFLDVAGMPPAVTGEINVNQQVTCNGGADGSATVSIATGTPPYQYSWSNNAGSTATVNTLNAGNYTVTITDAADQTLTLSTTLIEPDPIAINIQEKGDVDCQNTFGFVRVAASNGAGDYDYQWSNGDNGATINQLNTGNYTVTVTDANNCQNTLTVSIQDLSVLPVAEAGEDYTLDCNNATTTLSAAGSATGSNISYSWEATSGGNIVSGENTANPVVNRAGFYILTVTNNSNGCQAQDNVDVFEDFTTPNATINAPDELACNATATLDGGASTGNGNLTYLWEASNGGNIVGSNTNQTVVVDAAGTYFLTVTSSDNGCSNLTSVTLTNANAPTASAATSNEINCTNSTATISANGSTTGSNITYQWSTSDGRFVGSTDVFSTMVDRGGTYTLIVTNNDSNCSSSTTVVVTENTVPPTANAGAAAIIPCNSDRVRLDGRASSQGANFTYEWTADNGGNLIGGATSLQPTVNAAGTYTLFVTNNANGCTAMDRVVVTTATPPVANAGADQNLGCTGNSTTLSGAGSSQGENLIYSWSTTDGNIVSGETTLTPTIDQTGTYTLSVFNVETGCSAADQVQVNFAAAFDLNISSRTDILCNGAATGSVSVQPAMGTAPFIYTWSNGATTATNNNLTAGSYSVTVTDGNDCENTLTVELTEPTAINLDINANDESEAGANDGRAQVIATGGVSPFTFVWSNGATSALINNLPPATYTVTVTDANNCSIVGSTTVNGADCSLQTVNLMATATSCKDGANGSARIIVNGGLPPYNYSWSNGATTAENNNLVAGNYGLTVTDQGGCSIETSATVTEPAELIISSSNTFAVQCNGDNDGSAIVQITGGTGDYRFEWSSGSQSNQATNLIAGTYTVTVFDANNCTTTATLMITEPPALQLNVQGSNETTENAMDGTANVSAMGGTMPFTYNWSNGATSTTISNLAAGEYTVTVTDANGCTATQSITINAGASNPTLNAMIGDVFPVACFGESNGYAEVNVSSGTAPYTFVWSNGTTTAENAALPAGEYTVTVTDANNNEVVLTVTVTQPSEIIATTTKIDVMTANGMDGTATVNAMGGTPPYRYEWSNGATSESINNLVTGDYSVTVIDDQDCSTSAVVSIMGINCSGLSATINTTDITMVGSADGTATAMPMGGMPPYTYTWSNGATGQSINNLAAGDYLVTVTDSRNCAVTNTFSIQSVACSGFNISTSSSDVSTVDGNDGTAMVAATGGMPPYTYAWSNGATTATIADLAAGMYSVTVFDSQNCSTTASVDILAVDCSNFAVSLMGVAPSCLGTNDGDIIITEPTDTEGLNLSIINGAPTMLMPNIYTVTVSDQRGCEVEQSVTVPAADTLGITVTETTPATNNTATGSITIAVTGTAENITFGWVNSSGEIVSTEQNPMNLLPDTYNLQVVYNENCVQTLSNIVVDNITNTNEIVALKNIELYPNPTTDRLYLTLAFNETATVNWILFDHLGRNLQRSKTRSFQQERFTINTNDLVAGVYWLKVQIGEQWLVRKVVKQ